MREIETQAKLGRMMEVGSLQSVVESMLDNLLQDPAAVIGLTAIKGHDDYTLNHSINVCILSLSLGSALGLSGEELRSLGLAALLYDIGKVRIPEDMLAKPGPLTAEEWHVVKRHSEEGADLLKRIQLADKMPMIVAYEHHQRHDLLGYPEAITPAEQHIFSKIVAVCDAYDAMTTMRPFRREIRPDKALAVLMQGRAKAYDPGVTKALVAMLGIYPMGAVVKLDDDSHCDRLPREQRRPAASARQDARRLGRTLARDARDTRPARHRHQDRRAGAAHRGLRVRGRGGRRRRLAVPLDDYP